MKKIYLLLIILAFSIQFSFLPVFFRELQIPNLILIVATVIGVRKSLAENIAWFLLAGFVYELFSVDFFGFYLIIFTLVGFSVWFLKNIVLNKENSFLIEFLFWFLVKISWDFFYQAELLLGKLTLRNWQYNEAFFSFNGYFKETIIFILSGFLIKILCKKLFNISTQR